MALLTYTGGGNLKIGLVGSSYQEWSRPFDPQRTVNFYPVSDKKGGKEVSALYGTPGLQTFTTQGTGYIRGEFLSGNGRAFVVSGSQLIEIDSAGVGTVRGSIDQSIGNITIDENGFQLAICDGKSLYILTYSSNVFAKVTDPDLPDVGTVTFLDGYFICNKTDTGQFYISGVLDGTSWNALDFATAESSPDNLKRVIRGIGQLWLIGENTTEVWNNTGDSVFPFSVISGAQFNKGILAPYSAVEIDESLFWVGRDKNGVGTVYQTSGFSAVKISTPPIEQKIIAASANDELTAFTYNDQGHKFYMITGGGLETSLVYDLTTGEWHERAYKNEFGAFEQHLASSHMYAFGKHLVGSRVDGKIYEMSSDLYDDAGTEIIGERIYTNLSDENKRLRFNRLEIDFEGGVGLQSGQGSDPVCTVEVSKDGGFTWSDAYTLSIGKIGKYKKQAVLRRIGVAEQLTFRLRVSDPVKRAMTGSFLR